MRNIYQKLNVHSYQELMSLAERMEAEMSSKSDPSGVLGMLLWR